MLFTNLHFSSIIQRSCMMATNCNSCWCIVPGLTSHQYILLLCSKKILCVQCVQTKHTKRYITGKMLIVISYFKIQENWLAGDLMINTLRTFETLIRIVCMLLSTNVYLPFDLSFTFSVSVSCLPQGFDVRMPLFFSYYWIPTLWWVNDATVGIPLNCFAPLNVGHVQTPIL